MSIIGCSGERWSVEDDPSIGALLRLTVVGKDRLAGRWLVFLVVFDAFTCFWRFLSFLLFLRFCLFLSIFDD